MLGSPSSNFIEIVRRRKNLSFSKWRRKAFDASFDLGMCARSSNHDGYVVFISSSIHGDGIQAIYSGMG
jgi:hypothetical protein